MQPVIARITTPAKKAEYCPNAENDAASDEQHRDSDRNPSGHCDGRCVAFAPARNIHQSPALGGAPQHQDQQRSDERGKGRPVPRTSAVSRSDMPDYLARQCSVRAGQHAVIDVDSLIDHLLDRENLFNPLPARGSQARTQFAVAKQRAQRVRQCVGVFRRDQQTCHAVERNVLNAGAKARRDNRFAARHRFKLNQSELLGAFHRRHAEDVARLEVRRQQRDPE